MGKVELLVLFGAVVNIFATDDDVIDISHFGARIFGKPVKSVENWFDGKGNAEEKGPYLEGDLLIPTSSKNGMKSETLRWKKGEVPFEIRGGYSKLMKDT